MKYVLYHSNVDGAGKIAEFTDKHLAIIEANTRQVTSDDRDGNPYGYTYTVFEHRSFGDGRIVYRTRTTTC
jgi:hypothetical protein